MAKRTPDYTKQVSHQRARSERARPDRAGKERKGVPDAPVAYGLLTFVALLGGVAVYAWGCTQTLPYLTGPDGRKFVQGSIASVSGIVTNVLVGVLALYALYPRRYPLRRINKRYLGYAIVFIGLIAVYYSVNISVLSPGLIPPVAVFYFVIRSRLKEIAEAEGRYTPTKRDQALEEIRQRREERRREKEAEREKQRRLKARLGKVPADEVGARRMARQGAEKPAAKPAPARGGGAAGSARPAAPRKDGLGPSAPGGTGPRKGGGTR